MKVALHADELYPFYFTSTNIEFWDGEYTVDLPEDFDYEDYISACNKWNSYQDKLETIYKNKNDLSKYKL